MQTAPKPVIRKVFTATTVPELCQQLTETFADLQRQLDGQGRILPHEVNGKQPRGTRSHDRLMGRGKRGTVLAIPDAAGNVKSAEVPDSVTQYQDPQDGTGAPTTTAFPNVGDFGWYRDTTGNVTYFVQNRANAVEGVTLSTFSGSLSAAQHGVLTNNAVARHSNVTSTVDGFMAASDKVIFDAATHLDTVGTLAIRDGSGNCFFNVLLAENSLRTGASGSDKKVVGTQISGWGTSSNGTRGALNGATATLAQTREALAQLLIDLTSHGLIAT